LLGAKTPQALSVNSTSDALRITQTGAGNALLVEDSTNPDATPFVIDASGLVIIGNNSSIAGSGSRTPWLQVLGASNSTSSQSLNAFSATGTVSSVIQFNKSANATIGSHSLVGTGATLGRVDFSGSDGTGFIEAASIGAFVDGTPGSNDMPGRLVFSTRPDGVAQPLTERMRIDSSGNVIVGSGEASATPVGNTIHAPDAAGTNIAGANLTINAGNSTGNAVGGYVGIGATSTPGASGTSANAQADRMRVYPTSGAADGLAGVHVAQSGVYPATVPISSNGHKGAFTVHGISEQTANVQIINWGSEAGDEPNLNFMALNSNIVGTFGTTPVSGSNLGNITFEGYSGVGSDMLLGGGIFAEASGTWTSTNAPTAIRLQTAAATGAVATRILIDEDSVSTPTGTGFSVSETTATTAALAAAYIGNVFSGTYTPTLTNTTNISASTAAACQYMRVGNTVTVSGQVSGITMTAAGSANTVLRMTLPVASNLSAVRHVGGAGVFYSSQARGTAISIYADASDVAEFNWAAPTTTAGQTFTFSFTYQVL
jgi:hypothetical protein